MIVTDIKPILEGVPWLSGRVAYLKFPESEAPETTPYCVYQETDSHAFYADNTLYCVSTAVDIELYTDDRAPVLEKQVERALLAAGLLYNKTIDYLGSEACYMVTYTVHILEVVNE